MPSDSSDRGLHGPHSRDSFRPQSSRTQGGDSLSLSGGRVSCGGKAGVVLTFRAPSRFTGATGKEQMGNEPMAPGSGGQKNCVACSVHSQRIWRSKRGCFFTAVTCIPACLCPQAHPGE